MHHVARLVLLGVLVFGAGALLAGCGDDSETLSRERIINVIAEADDNGETTQLSAGMVADESIEFPFEVRLPAIDIQAPSSAERRSITSMEVVIASGLPCRVTQQAECEEFSCTAKFEMTDYGVCVIGFVGRTANGVTRECHEYGLTEGPTVGTDAYYAELNTATAACVDAISSR